MKLCHYFVYILLFTFNRAYSVEYAYPVACLDNGTTILLIHQLSSEQIELLQWNTQTNSTEQILWSLFNPAGFQLLPDQSGFSFIDNGRLRVKIFNKRSPKSIDFDEPIFNINSLRWIDEYSCYCSAQQGDDYNLFHLSTDGAIDCIGFCNNKDYLYPQKVENHLFYIERDKSDMPDNVFYHIMQAGYPVIEYNRDNSSTTRQGCNNIALDAKMIVDFNNSPIIFLRMQSLQEGFVIEHQARIDSNDTTMSFIYHHLIKDGDTWSRQTLFSFAIPSFLLIKGTEKSLYESILPLLPAIVDNKIYFVDCLGSDDYYLAPYCYDLQTGTTNNIALESKCEGHCFVPMLCGKRFYCGGTKPIGQGYPLISFLT
jgi:hypothetical protein